MQKKFKKIHFPIFIPIISCMLLTGCGLIPLGFSPRDFLPEISIRVGSETKMFPPSKEDFQNTSPEADAPEDTIPEEDRTDYDGTLQIKDGQAEPMLNYSTPDTPNDQSDILREVHLLAIIHERLRGGLQGLRIAVEDITTQDAEVTDITIKAEQLGKLGCYHHVTTC